MTDQYNSGTIPYPMSYPMSYPTLYPMDVEYPTDIVEALGPYIQPWWTEEVLECAWAQTVSTAEIHRKSREKDGEGVEYKDADCTPWFAAMIITFFMCPDRDPRFNNPDGGVETIIRYGDKSYILTLRSEPIPKGQMRGNLSGNIKKCSFRRGHCRRNPLHPCTSSDFSLCCALVNNIPFEYVAWNIYGYILQIKPQGIPSIGNMMLVVSPNGPTMIPTQYVKYYNWGWQAHETLSSIQSDDPIDPDSVDESDNVDNTDNSNANSKSDTFEHDIPNEDNDVVDNADENNADENNAGVDDAGIDNAGVDNVDNTNNTTIPDKHLNLNNIKSADIKKKKPRLPILYEKVEHRQGCVKGCVCAKCADLTDLNAYLRSLGIIISGDKSNKEKNWRKSAETEITENEINEYMVSTRTIQPSH